MARVVAFLALALGLGTAQLLVAQEVESRPDALFVSGRVDAFDTGGNGGGGGLEWLHPVAERGAFDLGAFAFSYLDTRWSYGKLGGYYFVWKELTLLTGEANVGAGVEAHGDFIYQIYKLGLSQALIDKRLYVSAEDEYFRVARVEENLLNVGVNAYPIRTLSARVNYHFSTAGNVDSHWLVGRLDWSVGRLTLIGGVAFGRATPERFDIITNSRRAVRTKEVFGGVSVPIGAHELTIVIDAVRQSTVERIGALFSWKIPF